MSRSRIVVLAVVAVVAGGPRRGAADGTDPIPVLGGMQIVSPGPRALGFAVLAAEPSGSVDFQVLVTLAYLRGRVLEADGRPLLMPEDVRDFQGDHVAADGVERHGARA